uniref:Uncharacterized protein n=1 Tax=Kuenenia stuttgartiensis TaxID=174633 RepID=Q1PVG2_KUEST|nr:unknown protein [Candidatus Kuenenia stuttgartiensis]
MELTFPVTKSRHRFLISTPFLSFYKIHKNFMVSSCFWLWFSKSGSPFIDENRDSDYLSLTSLGKMVMCLFYTTNCKHCSLRISTSCNSKRELSTAGF